MNNILNSIKLDYYILKSSDFRRMIIISIVPLIAGVLSKDPLLILGLAMMTSGFFMGTIFAVIEKSNLNKLYGVIPVEKRQTVIGRYVFTLLAGIAIAAAGTILTLIAAFIMNIGISSFAFSAWLGGSFLLYCFLISAQFPLYFVVDYSKSAAFANLPYILLILIGVFFIKKYPQIFTQSVAFFTHYPYLIWVIGILGALLLLGISMAISIALYNKHEL